MSITSTPWGEWEVLFESDFCKVKRLLIAPLKRLSYQTHQFREEYWTVVQGQALVVLDGQDHLLQAGQQLFIPLKAAHRIANPDDTTPLVIIEIQRGSYFGEDDITRLEDDFGRV
ncbi:MAG: phosphomannose isomerase type II C-terminal cupin domain [Candidatus Margulisiibacteriota bacterium]